MVKTINDKFYSPLRIGKNRIAVLKLKAVESKYISIYTLGFIRLYLCASLLIKLKYITEIKS